MLEVAYERRSRNQIEVKHDAYCRLTEVPPSIDASLEISMKLQFQAPRTTGIPYLRSPPTPVAQIQ